MSATSCHRDDLIGCYCANWYDLATLLYQYVTMNALLPSHMAVALPFFSSNNRFI